MECGTRGSVVSLRLHSAGFSGAVNNPLYNFVLVNPGFDAGGEELCLKALNKLLVHNAPATLEGELLVESLRGALEGGEALAEGIGLLYELANEKSLCGITLVRLSTVCLPALIGGRGGHGRGASKKYHRSCVRPWGGERREAAGKEWVIGKPTVAKKTRGTRGCGGHNGGHARTLEGHGCAQQPPPHAR